VKNGNGQRFIDFCVDNRLVFGNTVFKHKHIHKINFVGDGRDVQSVTDYIIFAQGMRRNFRDIKVIRGAEITLDHCLLIAETLFLKTTKKGEREKRYERIKIRKLREPEKQKEYPENTIRSKWDNRRYGPGEAVV
jgi:hypothetical protein